jgi:hypothetical protein
MWLTVVAGQALAQPPNLPNDVGNPDQTGMLPAPYAANYGTYPPQSYGGMPAGYPPGANAWPNITPYGPMVDQTANENGMWFNRIINGNRKYYFSAEGLLGNTNRPNSFVGGLGVNIIPANLSPGTIYPDLNQQFQENPLNFSLFTPDRETGAGGNGGGNATGSDIGVFQAQSTAKITDGLNAPGFRGTWGWTNADQSGFEASGFFLAPSSSTLFIGDERGFNPYQFNNAPAFGQLYLSHLHAIAGIPLQGADTDNNGLAGVVMPFDIYYRLQLYSQVAGANVDFLSSPIYEKPAFVVRPMFGARYFTSQETFQFDGADSGLGYTIGLPSNNGNGNNNGGTTGNGYLSPTVLETSASTLNIMTSQLVSKVSSQMAGPEAGLRFDVGGDRLKIWTTTKFGLLVNNSQRNLDGYNIGDAFYTKTGGTINDPTTMPRNNAAATRFTHEDNTTALSPMLEQSVMGKAHLFRFVPLLNKSKILDNAEFQAGFTLILIGNTYRPSNIIDWQAYPINPQLYDKRSSFMTTNYSLGIQWEY